MAGNSSNNRINSKMNQHHTLFCNLVLCGGDVLTVLFEKVCLFVIVKLVLHGKQFLAKKQREIA